MKRKICATCEYGSADELGDRVCVNSDSEFCTDWVGDEDTCPDWEERKRTNPNFGGL